MPFPPSPTPASEATLAHDELAAFGMPVALSAQQQQQLAAASTQAALGTLDIVLLFQNAELLSASNRRHQAVTLYRLWLAHTDSPLRYAGCFNLAVTLCTLGRYAEAELACEAALQLRPEFNLARFQLAQLLERRGCIDQALDQWRAVVQQERASGSAELAMAEQNLRRFLAV